MGEYRDVIGIVRDRVYFKYVYNGTLYYVQRPIKNNIHKALLNDVISIERDNSYYYILRSYSLDRVENYGDCKHKTIRIKANPFKMEVNHNECVYIAYDNCITYVDTVKDIMIETQHKGIITDVMLRDDDWYIYAIDGIIYSTARLSKLIKTIELSKKIYKFGHQTPIYDGGFVFNNAFIDVGRTPSKTISQKYYALAIIDNSLYRFDEIDNNMYCTIVHDDVDDMWYDAEDKIYVISSGGDFYCLELEDNITGRSIKYESTR